MNVFLTAVLVVSFLLLFLIYGGYVLVLRFILMLVRPEKDHGPDNKSSFLDDEWPPVCVYLSARNEASIIEQRLSNIIDTSYPLNKLEIIVVSDNSTDNTSALARSFSSAHPNVDITVIDDLPGSGQSFAQNKVAEISSADILVSTDADTKFMRNTLCELVSPLLSENIAVAGGVIKFSSENITPISSSYLRYRMMEREVRCLETRLGVLSKVDGACLAYKKCIWEPIQPYEDVDQVIVLFARKNGYLSVQANHAECVDFPNANSKQEIKARARMTRKSLLSTFNRWKLIHVFRYPMFSVALTTHKLLRYISPLLCLAFAAAFTILFWSWWILVLVLVSAAAITFVAAIRGKVKAFICAQIGFALGVFGWLSGDKNGIYLPMKNIRR